MNFKIFLRMNIEKELNIKVKQISSDYLKLQEDVQKREELVTHIFAELGNLAPLENNRFLFNQSIYLKFLIF